jgi:hypothetical protein
MSAKQGKMYKIRAGRGRPLWAYGPKHPKSHREDFIMATVSDGEQVMFIEECRDHAGNLQWVKVVFGEHVGYLQCQFLSVGSLLDPMPGCSTFHLPRQDPRSA